MLTHEQLEAISHLVDQYERLSDADRRRYSETETRTNFIDHLFLALDWPVYDRAHVERETTVAEGKRPDYIFKLHGVPRVFLEAKPFREDIYDRGFARDAITKAYNKGVPWAGITNFAALVIFDAQEELQPGAPPLRVVDPPPARVLDLTYPDYLRPDSGLHYLTPDALDQRLLDEQAQRSGIRRRAVPIEKRLYQSMRDWRENLFNQMSSFLNWHTKQEIRQGDEAIQRLIDRLMFLRNCEDRGIGEPGLRALRNRIRSRDRNVRVTESLLRLFTQSAATYDSELFQTEALIDLLLQGLTTRTDLDDTLAEIVEGLYSVPRSYAEYDFAQMDADVLGQVYEQYLGFVPQRVRKLAAQKPLPGFPAHDIAVDAKRQRRKERGIYYTPRWVVRYIVQQTLDSFLEQNREDEGAIADLTILDPACGSGSFLIHAYETLLEHHAAKMGGDVGHLDTRTREWILTHNIFGVDLDPQAVEIARLNLLIRMVRQQEILPELKDNIRVGNSLISGTGAQLRPFFDDHWKKKHPFDWEREFPQIMERGGFDIIIGNPPYVRIQTLPRDEVAYYNERYEAATGNYDIYALFVERGLQLLRPGGMLGFIIPNKFMQAQYGKGLRKLLGDSRCVSKIVDFGDAQIFESGTNYTCLLFLRRQPVNEVRYIPAAVAVKERPQAPALLAAESTATTVDAARLGLHAWTFPSLTANAVMRRLEAVGRPLGQVAERIFQGIRTSANDIYILSGGQAARLEPHFLRPLLRGKEIKPYAHLSPKRHVLIPYRVLNGEPELVPASELQESYPKTWDYLQANRKALEERERGRMRHDRWYAYVYPKNLKQFARPKILTPDIAPKASFGIDREGRYCFVSGYGIVLKSGVGVQLEYVLGLLNSRLLDFYLRRVSTRLRGGFYRYFTQFLAQLPIRLVDSEDAEHKRQHDDIVALVQRMLDLHQRLAANGGLLDNEREQIERDITRTDREIDDLVYDLYGLTAKERALIEAEVVR